ncbi:DUF1365 domain-containing protein [Nocardiopsis protaetiae]|uniref:DUF1365 domain-containing protein n=1 Tax=Nocardiopsis protaetiae TaxID=3382270 RepID=UPI00387B6E43
MPALYEAVVRHVRAAPVRSAFAHRTYYWLTDLDRPPRLPWPLRPLAGFGHRATRADLEGFLAGEGVRSDGGPILVLAHARVLGYVFDPLTVYWCHRRDGTLARVVAEVHNTYGDRHRYLLDVDGRGRADTAKAMYVSPFHGVEGTYRLALPEPGERLALTVTLHTGGAPPFAATVRGRRVPATAASLLRLALRHPLAPLVGALRIRTRGIGLYLRGVPIRPRPTHHGSPAHDRTGARP